MTKLDKADEVIAALQDVAFVCDCGEEHLAHDVSPYKTTRCRNCDATYSPFIDMNGQEMRSWYRAGDRP